MRFGKLALTLQECDFGKFPIWTLSGLLLHVRVALNGMTHVKALTTEQHHTTEMYQL